MTSNSNKVSSPRNERYKLSRKGKKLQLSNDQRTLLALPKDISERTWSEIYQKEENELIALDIREEIIEDAMIICYEKYMKRQNVLFTAYCASEAWLKLINWNFFRHDPGEEPSAYPPCYIPKREESWTPDVPPDPSPKDTWCQQDLVVLEEDEGELVKRWSSSTSLDYPVVDDIAKEYWFPGKVNIYIEPDASEGSTKTITYESESSTSIDNIGTESEVIEKVTTYSPGEVAAKESTQSALKTSSPIHGSLEGAGDSATDKRPKRRFTDKSKLFSKTSVIGRSKATLPPLDDGSRSRISMISDCRLRNLRLDTQYEITSEKIDSPSGEVVKRK